MVKKCYCKLCEKGGEGWTPRVEHPKQCPFCKRYDWNEDKAKKKENKNEKKKLKITVKNFYKQWLEDNNLLDTEENHNYWSEHYCQFCGNSNDYGDCGCDHEIRY